MKLIRSVAVLFLALLLNACHPEDSSAIRFGLASAPANLDPRFATDATSERINRLIYERLVDHDAQARPVPSLASWQLLSPEHYRFYLPEQPHRFHNGELLTSRDVAATYRSMLDPATASPHRGALALIKQIKVIDDRVVDFYLYQPDPLFPGTLTVGILPAGALASGHPFHHAPLGSGPFRFTDWSDPGRLYLQRTDDDSILVFEQVKDPTMRVLKLLRGEIDLLQNDLSPELLAYLEKQNGVAVQRAPGSNFAYLGFQMEDTATGVTEVRRAIALAIDRPAIIKYLFHGAARPASALLPPEHWAGDNTLPVIQRDIERARLLLAGAGYDASHPLHLSYKTSSDPFRLRIATVLQQQLARASIDVDVQSYDWGTFYGDIKAGRFQMYSLAWVGIKSPDIFRYAFYSDSLPPEGANRGRLQDSRVDQLIDRARSADSLESQAVVYRELQEYLLELLPCVPLWYEDQYAVTRGLRGYTLASDGAFDALTDTTRTH